jgi:hypothetical protein
VKREPTLLDRYLQVKGHEGPPLSRYLEAHKFVFDAKASKFVGDLLRRAPLEILQEHEFARTPFPVTWVEIDHTAYWEGLGLASAIPPDGKEDTHVGFLFDHNKVWMISMAADGRGPDLIPLILNMHQRISPDQERRFAEDLMTSRLTLRFAMLGYINVPPDSDWWKGEEADEICRSHRMEWYDGTRFGPMPREAKLATLQGSAGHLKLVVALALLLTRPGRKVMLNSDVAHHRTIFRGKNIVYKAHHHVTIRLAHRDPVVRFTTALATGLHRRRHGVRGHWAQTRRLIARGCGHQWDIIDKDHYQCAACSAKRWWVKHHARGDATRGFVTKDYPVTT